MPDYEWIGALQACDLCGNEYPMAWIEYNGKQFLCAACRYEKDFLTIALPKNEPQS